MSVDDDRQEYVSRRVMLPAHVWLFIEQEATTNHHGDIPTVVQEMYHQARTYRAMVALPGKKARMP